MEFITREDCQIYSPESTDGKIDWATRLTVSAVATVLALWVLWW